MVAVVDFFACATDNVVATIVVVEDGVVVFASVGTIVDDIVNDVVVIGDVVVAVLVCTLVVGDSLVWSSLDVAIKPNVVVVDLVISATDVGFAAIDTIDVEAAKRYRSDCGDFSNTIFFISIENRNFSNKYCFH